jgi:predicted Zn-dependent protease
MAVYRLKPLEKSVEKTQRTFIRLALGIPCALVLLGFGIWSGWRAYEHWEEGHLIRRAAAFLKGGDFRATTLSARRALQLNPNSAGAMRVIAQVAEQARDRAALDWRRRVTELEPHSSQDALALAECALQFGDVRLAEKTLTRIDATGKQTAAFHAATARLAKAENKPAEAKQQWAEALRLAPNEESYQLEFALICLEQPTAAEREEGSAVLQRLRASPTQRTAATRSLILDGAVHHEDARKLRPLAEELQSYPEAPFTDRILYLEILRQLRDPEYTSYLTKIENDASQKGPDLAALLTWMNANQMSMIAIDFAKSVPPAILNKWPVPWAMAEAFAKSSDWGALERLTTGANWEQFDFLRRAYLARALRAEEKSAAAEHEWSGALKSASSQAQSLLLLTRVVSEWRWSDKTVDLLWALAKHPEKQNEAFMTLYQHYAKTEDTQGLYRVLLRLAELDPADSKVQNNLAQISLLLNADVDRARRIAADLYRKEPSNAAYVSTYAFSLYAKGDTNAAIKVMNTLPEDQYRDPSLAAYYGIMLAAAGEIGKAREYLQIGRTATLLPEEKLLIDHAEAASK